MKLILIFLITLSFVTIDATAQREQKNKKNIDDIEQSQRSNSFRPFRSDKKETTTKKVVKEDKKNFTFQFNKILDKKVAEFYERLEKNSKKDRKIQRKMQHPQYSDFSYFGHKKKPKIRPVGKRKYCEECGIVH